MRNCRFQKSFTLIELLTILLISGILVSIGIPAFKAYQPNLQLSGTVRELVTDLRRAEQLAVTEQIEHGVAFFPETGQYRLIRHGAVDEVIEQKDLPEEVSFQQISGLTNDEAVFNPYGAAQETGSVTLINTKNSSTTIEIRPSGFIKIVK